MPRPRVSRLTARVDADAEAVYAWWTHPDRLAEMKVQWASMADFRWTESIDGDRTLVETGWTTSSRKEVCLTMTLHRLGFPRTRNEMRQVRRHPDGREDHSISTSDVEFWALGPKATDVRVVTSREQSGWRWWESMPSARRRRTGHSQQHLNAQAAKCQLALTGVEPAQRPAPAPEWW